MHSASCHWSPAAITRSCLACAATAIARAHISLRIAVCVSPSLRKYAQYTEETHLRACHFSMASATEKQPDGYGGEEERRVSVARTEKGRWERLWPVIACGAGLFSDGYLNNVRLCSRDWHEL